jgi:hypothetical protein
VSTATVSTLTDRSGSFGGSGLLQADIAKAAKRATPDAMRGRLGARTENRILMVNLS